MITVLGNAKRACDGVSRREVLRAGAVSLLGGMTLPRLLEAETVGRAARAAGDDAARWLKPGKAKSVILLNLFGGPPTQDIFDLKPKAPLEIRGPFKPISTSAPGVQICEHLPKTAQWMHRAALVRSLNRPGNDHVALPMLSGYTGPPLPGSQMSHVATDADPPSMGSVCSYLGMGRQGCPPYVHMPCDLGWGQLTKRSGQYAGFLGKQHNPLVTECTPSVALPASSELPQIVRGTPRLPNLSGEIAIDRLRTRRSLLEQFEASLREQDETPSLTAYNQQYRAAFDLLTSSECRAAFDLEREDPQIRDRYGRSLFGESVLTARRLVERGARFVTATYDVFWHSPGQFAMGKGDIDQQSWDLHYNTHRFLRELLLPQLDMVFTALMEDLERTGLLDETLVIVMGEMGRAAKINRDAGRDHWTACYAMLMAGAGIQGGAVYGSSDRRAEYPNTHPVTPGDVCATVYRCLGVYPEMTVRDRTNRPILISHGGRPIEAILA